MFAPEVPIIDADIHHASDHGQILSRMPKALASRGLMTPGRHGYGNPHGVNRRDAVPPSGGAACSDPGYAIEHHFEPNNIRYGLLHPAGLMALGVSADYRFAAAACRAYNDYLLDSWLSYSDRFVGAILVAANWPEEAAKEIRRVGRDDRFREVIMTAASEAPLGQARYWPIYEAACEVGLPVAVHPGAEGVGISHRPYAGMPSSYFEWHTSLSQNYMGQLAPVCQGKLGGTALPGKVGEYKYGLDGQVVRCPWHGWEFDVTTGRSLFNPHRCRVRSYEAFCETESGERVARTVSSDEPDPAVETFPVEVEGAWVVVRA